MARYMLAAILLMCVSVAAVQAADVSGRWQAQIPGRDGNLMDTTFNFKVAGEQLTGTMENQYGEREISDGKVAGTDISFVVQIEFNGNRMTLVYNGKVAGNEIRFTRERRGGDGPPAKVEFVAKRKN